MEQITISQAQKYTSPNPISLVCAEGPNGVTNMAAISWWTYLANRPPMLGFAISKKSYTGELVKETGKAVLSIPGEIIAKEAYQCGRVSGRDTNKVAEFGIALTGDNQMYPIHSKLAFICTLESTSEVGDHIFFACNIDDIFYNGEEKQLYAWDGYAELAPLGGR